MRWSIASTCTVIAVELTLALLAVACGSVGTVSVRGPAPPTQQSPDEIEVLADINEIRRPYDMVGYVEAEDLADPDEPGVSFKDLLLILKERARELGAHALVEINTHPLDREGRQGLKVTAIAIVFTD